MILFDAERALSFMAYCGINFIVMHHLPHVPTARQVKIFCIRKFVGLLYCIQVMLVIKYKQNTYFSLAEHTTFYFILRSSFMVEIYSRAHRLLLDVVEGNTKMDGMSPCRFYSQYSYIYCNYSYT